MPAERMFGSDKSRVTMAAGVRRKNSEARTKTAAFEYRQMQAERAARDAVVALRIAANKLNMTRDKALRRWEN